MRSVIPQQHLCFYGLIITSGLVKSYWSGEYVKQAPLEFAPMSGKSKKKITKN